MNISPHNRFTELFEQLGLAAEPDAIARFIASHRLHEGQAIYEAEFWDDSQRQFLKSALAHDAEWAVVVDSLAVSLSS